MVEARQQEKNCSMLRVCDGTVSREQRVTMQEAGLLCVHGSWHHAVLSHHGIEMPLLRRLSTTWCHELEHKQHLAGSLT